MPAARNHSAFARMNRLTVLADIAGRAMLSVLGSPRTVAGAVAIDTSALDSARAEVLDLPKWGRCNVDHAEHVVDYLASQAVAIGVVSVNRDTDRWRHFELDASLMQLAIAKHSKGVAGWAKAPNLLKFLLLGSVCAVTMGHAIGVDRRPRIQSASGRQLIECSTICDREIEGSENIEVFTSFWSEQRIPRSRLARMGVEMIGHGVCVTTEQEEPALMLADYVAGLGLAATLENPGRLPLPLDRDEASRLLRALHSKCKLVAVVEDFDYTHDEIFGHVMEQARQLDSKQRA